MSMPEDYDISIVTGRELCRSRAPNFVSMADVNAETIDSDHQLFGKLGLIHWIGVSEYSSDRRDQS